jgi:hypothetical protein
MFLEYPDTINNQIKFYNEDFSVYKTVNIDRPKGYNIDVELISEQLFNLDSSIEFICVFYKQSYTNINGSSTMIKLYNDNGTIVKDFGTYNYMGAGARIISKGGINQLLIDGDLLTSLNPYKYQYVYQLYSLPGSMPNNVSELKISDIKSAYPNPSKTIVNLPYELAKGQTSTMRIFNINGQLMEQKQIDSEFDKIRLNVNSYKSGTYLYEYNGISKKFIVN